MVGNEGPDENTLDNDSKLICAQIIASQIVNDVSNINRDHWHHDEIMVGIRAVSEYLSELSKYNKVIGAEIGFGLPEYFSRLSSTLFINDDNIESDQATREAVTAAEKTFLDALRRVAPVEFRIVLTHGSSLVDILRELHKRLPLEEFALFEDIDFSNNQIGLLQGQTQGTFAA